MCFLAHPYQNDQPGSFTLFNINQLQYVTYIFSIVFFKGKKKPHISQTPLNLRVVRYLGLRETCENSCQITIIRKHILDGLEDRK